MKFIVRQQDFLKRQGSMFRAALLFAFCCAISILHAQEPQADRQITAEQWERASADLDYSKDQLEVKEPKDSDWKFPSFPNFDMTGIGTIFQVLIILIAAFLVGWFIYKMVQQPSNRSYEKYGKITLENLEEHLEESDLDRFLREALAAEKYSDAVRIQFLRIMKGLNEKGHIKWAKEKTNRDYLNALARFPHVADVRTQTRIYEKVWYGNMSIDKPLYETLAPGFQALFQKI